MTFLHITWIIGGMVDLISDFALGAVYLKQGKISYAYYTVGKDNYKCKWCNAQVGKKDQSTNTPTWKAGQYVSLVWSRLCVHVWKVLYDSWNLIYVVMKQGLLGTA